MTEAVSVAKVNAESAGENAPGYIGKLFSGGKRGWLIVGIIAFVALGALGAGLKYLEDDARRQSADGSLKNIDLKEQGLLNRINPFIPAPTPSPTPQLSKEYIYAGGKMLAVEDANANAAPPADLAVWRPSNGLWCVMGSQGSQQTFVQWGQAGDRPAVGDFDGDGKTDFSVYRAPDPQTNGHWYILQSGNNVFLDLDFGIGSDKLAQADYDGDGRTDAAIFRSSTGYWYIRQSSNGNWVQHYWGASTDIPAPADYDGDGKADIAVWRQTDAKFYYLSSSSGSANSYAITVGAGGIIPVPGDYDGDGKADAAVWGAGADENEWHIVASSGSSITPLSIGVQASDIAVQNDYDGDGKVDRAVWRPSNGTWYISQSTKLGQPNEYRIVQWGMEGDIPVPAFYRR